MDANALQINNYTVKQVPHFGPNLQVTQDWVVRFMLGEHGPFTLTYDHKPLDTELQKDMGAIAQTVRAGANVTV